MPASVTPLSARSQTLTTALFWVIVAMGLSPLLEIFVLGWPPRFGEVLWRFDAFRLYLSDGPQFAIFVGVIAMFATLIGHRIVVRSAAVALAFIAASNVVILPFFVLDYFQKSHLIRQTDKPAFKLEMMKLLIIAGILILTAAWAAYAGWLASEPPDAAARRAKGDGLVVGQPKPSRPPT